MIAKGRAIPAFIQIEIAIGIGVGVAIGFGTTVPGRFFSNLIASSAQPAEHRRHTVQLHLPAFAFRFAQGVAHNQDILNRRTFQRRTASDFKIASSISIRRLAVAFSNV